MTQLFILCLKTVVLLRCIVMQVMALLAYLMEFKNNFGPHLIIVPNAVIVNWKSELQTWLPHVK